MKYLMSHFCSVECEVFANMLCFRVTNYPSYNLMSVIDFAIICIPRKECLWQQFLSRLTNIFVKLFLLFECLADWEKITSNGFLHTDPEILLYDKHMVRISMSDVKWVKTRDKFGVSYASELCLKKWWNIFIFAMVCFWNKAYYRGNSWRYKSAVFFMSRTRISWTCLCIFYPVNFPQFLKHSYISEQFWRKYGNFENRKISTLSKKIKNWWMA